MAEHIVDFFNIGTRLTERFGYCVPFIRAINQERKECIVRCRDCKYWEEWSDDCARTKTWLNCDGDGFCAWGEVK